MLPSNGGKEDMVGVRQGTSESAEYEWDDVQGFAGLTGRCCYPVLEIQGVLPQGHETGAFCRRESGRAFKEDGVSGEASLSRTRTTRHGVLLH